MVASARRKFAGRYSSSLVIQRLYKLLGRLSTKRQLAASPGVDNDWLPEEYHLSHELCYFIHDQLVETLRSGEEARIFDVQIKFDTPQQASEATELVGKEFVEWLKTNDRHFEVLYLFYKQLTVALLSDFLHFVYEGLRCSSKAKLAVSYSLLRKPFKENLFYFEWLLADPADFLQKFDNGNVREIVLSRDLSPERRKEIISGALAKTAMAEWDLADLLYELRYDRNAEYGFERLWQKATHLVTTRNGVATEPTNLNFIFSGDKERILQWDHMYAALPFLLYYALQVTEALLATFAQRKDQETDLIPLRTQIGFMTWVAALDHDHGAIPVYREIAHHFAELGTTCDACGVQLQIGKAQVESFWKLGEIQCKSCRKVHEV